MDTEARFCFCEVFFFVFFICFRPLPSVLFHPPPRPSAALLPVGVPLQGSLPTTLPDICSSGPLAAAAEREAVGRLPGAREVVAVQRGAPAEHVAVHLNSILVHWNAWVQQACDLQPAQVA